MTSFSRASSFYARALGAYYNIIMLVTLCNNILVYTYIVSMLPVYNDNINDVKRVNRFEPTILLLLLLLLLLHDEDAGSI